MLKKIFKHLQDQHNRSVAVVFGMQVLSLLLSLAATLLITNHWGPSGYGVYAYAFSWATLLGSYACAGMEQAGLRLIPTFVASRRTDLLTGFVQMAAAVTLVASLLLAAAALAATVVFDFPREPGVRQGMWLGLLAVPVIAGINLRASWLRSLHLPVWSQLPDKLLRPMVFLMLVVLLWWLAGDAAGPMHLVLLGIASILIAFAAGWYRSRRELKRLRLPAQGMIWRGEWLQLGGSLLLISGTYYLLAQLPMVLLGALHDAHQTGLFAVAYRISDMEGYFLFAINVVLAPMISRLYAEGRTDDLQRNISSALRFGFLMALPLMMLCLLAPAWVLHFFGTPFRDAAWLLVVLTAGQMITFALGPVSYLLTMSGHERVAMRLLLGSAVFCLLLCWLLIPRFGAEGAAWAVAINSVLLHATLAHEAHKRTGINPTLLRLRR